MQIPTGVLADAWGPRRLLTVGAFTAAPGRGFIFRFRKHVNGLSGTIAHWRFRWRWPGWWSSSCANNWLPPEQFALSSGLALVCGVLGAVSAGVPLRILVDAFGWRPVIFFSGIFTLLVGAAIWFFARDLPSQKGVCGSNLETDTRKSVIIKNRSPETDWVRSSSTETPGFCSWRRAALWVPSWPSPVCGECPFCRSVSDSRRPKARLSVRP